MPFDSFSQVRPPEMAEFGQNVQNSDFLKFVLFLAVSLQWMRIGSYERSWRIDVPIDSCGQRRLAKIAHSFEFPKQGHIRDSQYPFESGGRLGPFRVSQILPCQNSSSFPVNLSKN